MWDDSRSNHYLEWFSARASNRNGIRGFFAEYGVLIGTIAIIAVFVAILFQQGSDRIEIPEAQQRLTWA
jgi:hypothetical protein